MLLSSYKALIIGSHVA